MDPYRVYSFWDAGNIEEFDVVVSSFRELLLGDGPSPRRTP